jgi:HlyD family secretion protein
VKLTENGSIRARKTIDIKCERDDGGTILNIVPEGTYITQEDVDNGKVLIELDAASLKEELTQRKMDLASAEASYTQAKESHEIQIKQNESDITAADLSVKFGLIDIRKYLGDSVAEKVVANDETSPEEADSLDKDRKEISWKQAQTATDLFKKYEFPKQAVQLLSNYNEFKRALDRTHASTRSRLAQAEANLKSTESKLRSRQERLNRTKREIAASIIKAPAPGLVTYGGASGKDHYRRGPIEEGSTVHEHQTIITLPDMSKMTASIAVHESSVDKVRPGQRATIVMEAFPDKTFYGEVTKVAPLPDRQDRMFGSELKVYKTEVEIEGTYDFLKPGMSANVEIVVEQLENVLIVPVKVVANRGGKKVCYVVASKPKERQVKTGSFNDTFVQIIDGLESGEKVLLSLPKITGSKDQYGSEPQDEAGSQDKDKISPEKQIRSEAQSQAESEPQNQNQLREALVGHVVAKLNFFRDIGVLQVRPDGMWEEES